MYRKNVASQTVYAVAVNATTGAAETSGVSVAISKDGAASAAGTGTLAHIAEGLWAYTFAQAELNATATGFVFYKSGAVPVGGGVRTTQANPDDAAALGLSNLDAAISTRSTYAGGDTSGTSTLLTRITSTRAGYLDNLSAGAVALEATAQAILTDTGTDLPATLSTIAGYIDTEVAAIKAKTDLIPAAPAATSDIPTTAQIADKILGRAIAGGADGGRTVTQALQALRNKVTRSGSTLTVYAADDSTSSWTATITTDAAAEPVTGVDPA